MDNQGFVSLSKVIKSIEKVSEDHQEEIKLLRDNQIIIQKQMNLIIKTLKANNMIPGQDMVGQ